MSNQAPENNHPNNAGQSGSVSRAKLRTKRSPQTSPKAGRDPVQPNNRGNQGTN